MSHPVDFATKKIERRKNFCVGPVMYDNTCQFSGVWHRVHCNLFTACTVVRVGQAWVLVDTH